MIARYYLSFIVGVEIRYLERSHSDRQSGNPNNLTRNVTMKSALYLAAALAAGLTTQAFAADQAASPSSNAPAVSAQAAALTADANAQAARKILLAQGYTNVSELNRDAKGHWAGTAVKNGKTLGVAIVLPSKEISVSKTN
jgi:hypothetical protein